MTYVIGPSIRAGDRPLQPPRQILIFKTPLSFYRLHFEHNPRPKALKIPVVHLLADDHQLS